MNHWELLRDQNANRLCIAYDDHRNTCLGLIYDRKLLINDALDCCNENTLTGFSRNPNEIGSNGMKIYKQIVMALAKNIIDIWRWIYLIKNKANPRRNEN